MEQNLIFIPVLVQVLLTLVLFILLGKAKTSAQSAGEVDEARRALHADAWPEAVIKINNNIRNQFEVPVLFYVVSFVGWGLQIVDYLFLTVAVLFVLTRLVHARIHTGSNYVPIRRRVFTIGTVLVLVMTGICIVEILI